MYSGDVLPEICRDGMNIPDDEVYGIRPVGKSKCLFRVKSETLFGSLMSRYDGKVLKYSSGEVKISNESKITTYVKIRSVPFEMPSFVLENVFSHYGKVKHIRENTIGFGHYSFALSGDRTIFIELEKHIPSYVSIRGQMYNVLYNGQPRTCKKCGNTGHFIAECSVDVSTWVALKSTEFPDLTKSKDHVPEPVPMDTKEKKSEGGNRNQNDNNDRKLNSVLVDGSGIAQEDVSMEVHEEIGGNGIAQEEVSVEVHKVDGNGIPEQKVSVEVQEKADGNRMPQQEVSVDVHKVDGKGMEYQELNVEGHNEAALIDLNMEDIIGQPDNVMPVVMENNGYLSDENKQQADVNSLLNDTPVCSDGTVAENNVGDRNSIPGSVEGFQESDNEDIAQAIMPFSLGTPNMQLINLSGDGKSPLISEADEDIYIASSQGFWPLQSVQQSAELNMNDSSVEMGKIIIQSQLNVDSSSLQDVASGKDSAESGMETKKDGKVVKASKTNQGTDDKEHKEKMIRSTKRKASPGTEYRVKKF